MMDPDTTFRFAQERRESEARRATMERQLREAGYVTGVRGSIATALRWSADLIDIAPAEAQERGIRPRVSHP